MALKKIDIDLPLFLGNSTMKYVVWYPNYLHNTDERRFYNTLQKCGFQLKKKKRNFSIELLFNII